MNLNPFLFFELLIIFRRRRQGKLIKSTKLQLVRFIM